LPKAVVSETNRVSYSVPMGRIELRTLAVGRSRSPSGRWIDRRSRVPDLLVRRPRHGADRSTSDAGQEPVAILPGYRQGTPTEAPAGGIRIEKAW